MSSRHTVLEGDCLVSIAERYGFFWESLWNHPENATLRETRLDPTVLHPGDVVFVPDKVIKEYVRPTGARHQFRVKNVPAKFNLQLLDVDDKPRGGLAYTFTVDGAERHGTTDGEGNIEADLALARAATLVLDGLDERYDIDLGHLDLVNTLRGAQERLAALGIYSGAPDGDLNEETERALRDFQLSEGLIATGILDDSTQAALRRTYGS